MVGLGDRVEDYVVEGVLGEGGMATVYRARHDALGTEHALKLLGQVPRGAHRRLALEGEVQARLRHPNIVAVTGVVTFGGRLALVMELVGGPPLSALVRRHPLDVRQVDAIARRILGAVAHAHAHGIVHRDLKPANVLVEVRGDALVPKVADFGLAKALDPASAEESPRTRTGAAMGTPAYMSPEQIRNSKDVDPRADVWSLGVLLYELLCGARPFAGEELVELYELASKGAYPAPEDLVPDLPRRMGDAIRRALEPDRDRRTSDAGALLAQWAGGTPEPPLTGEGWAPVLEGARALARELEDESTSQLATRGSAGTLASFSGPSAAEARTVPPEPRRARPFRHVVQIAGLGLVFLLAIGVTTGAGLAVLSAGRVGGPDTSGASVIGEASKPTESVDAADDAVEESSDPSPKEAVRRARVTAPSASVPEPAPAPAPAPTARARPTGAFEVEGELRAWLVASDGARFDADGPVPLGTYEIWAALPEAEAIGTGVQVTVGASDRLVITCSEGRGSVAECAFRRR